MAPEAHLHAWKQRVRDWEAELEARGSAPETRDDPAGRWDDVVGRRLFPRDSGAGGRRRTVNSWALFLVHWQNRVLREYSRYMYSRFLVAGQAERFTML